MRHSELERLLPAVLQRAKPPGSPLAAVLDVMEALHGPSERVLAELASIFDPRRCDERFLTMLAHWVHLERILPPADGAETDIDWRPRDMPMAPGRLRALISAAPWLARMRGTARGLMSFLEIAVGERFAIEEQVIDERGVLVPFHVRIAAPAGAEGMRELIVRIIELEKPAHVTYELVFGDGPG